MKHNAIFISNYGAGKAGVVKLDDQAYNQFTSPNDAEFVKFKKAYADGKLGSCPHRGIRWNADVNAAWNILVKNNENVSLNLDRNRVERGS